MTLRTLPETDVQKPVAHTYRYINPIYLTLPMASDRQLLVVLINFVMTWLVSNLLFVQNLAATEFLVQNVLSKSIINYVSGI